MTALKRTYRFETRVVKVTHPNDENITLFEAVVKVFNMNTKFVKKITRVDIKYQLRNDKEI